MTKTELRDKIEAFIKSKSSTSFDEWYCTDRSAARLVLHEFAATLNIDIQENAEDDDES